MSRNRILRQTSMDDVLLVRELDPNVTWRSVSRKGQKLVVQSQPHITSKCCLDFTFTNCAFAAFFFGGAAERFPPYSSAMEMRKSRIQGVDIVADIAYSAFTTAYKRVHGGQRRSKEFRDDRGEMEGTPSFRLCDSVTGA